MATQQTKSQLQHWEINFSGDKEVLSKYDSVILYYTYYYNENADEI